MDMIEKSLNGTTYWEILVGDVQPNSPTVLALHYMTGDATSLQVLFTNLNRPIRVVFLQGRYPYEGGYSWYSDEERFYDRPEAAQAPDIKQESDAIAAFLSCYKAENSGKVVVTGMSQGGDLTLALCAYYPDLLHLALPMAGRLSSVMRPEQPPQTSLPRVSMMQGADDHIVSVASAEEAVEWLRQSGYEAELHVYPGVGHAISYGMVDHIQQTLMAL
jgi:predicted esterase